MLVFTFKYQILHLSSISNMNLTIQVATSDVKNSPVFTDLEVECVALVLINIKEIRSFE